MLQETYDQEMKSYSAGHLRLKTGIQRNSRTVDGLVADDLAAMSAMSFSYFHWYDNGIKYLKSAIDGYYSLSNDQRNKPPRFVEKILLIMKKQYPCLLYTSPSPRD